MSVDTVSVLKYSSDSIANFIQKQLNDSVKIPDGKVYIQFSVMKDKSIKDYKIFRGIDPYFDNLAMEAVKTIKVLEPAIFYGKEVNSKVIFPIIFKSSSKKKR